MLPLRKRQAAQEKLTSPPTSTCYRKSSSSPSFLTPKFARSSFTLHFHPPSIFPLHPLPHPSFVVANTSRAMSEGVLEFQNATRGGVSRSDRRYRAPAGRVAPRQPQRFPEADDPPTSCAPLLNPPKSECIRAPSQYGIQYPHRFIPPLRAENIKR